MNNTTPAHINIDQFRRNWPNSFNESMAALMQIDQVLRKSRLEANAYVGQSIDMSVDAAKFLSNANISLGSSLESLNSLLVKIRPLEQHYSQLHRELNELRQQVTTLELSYGERLDYLDKAIINLNRRINKQSRQSSLKGFIMTIGSKIKRLLGS